jgi:hypothetical protein
MTSAATKAERARAFVAELSLDERANFYRLPPKIRDRCIEQMIDREQRLHDYPLCRAEAQARADTTGKAVAVRGRWLEPRTRIERRL